MKKLFLYILFLLILSVFASGETCKSTPVSYYGFCDPVGDLKIYDSSGNLLQSQPYSETSGCTSHIYRAVISGGPGCSIDEGSTIVFKISGKTAGAVAWHALSSSVQLNITTTGRTFVFVAEPKENIIVEDEEGVDVTKYGSGGGGSSSGGQKTVSVKQSVNGTDVEIIKFNTSIDENRVIDFRLDQNGVFVNLGATNFSEILIPAFKKSGALYVCAASENINCTNRIVIELGQTINGLHLESRYREIGGASYYVLQGLTFGSVEEVDKPAWLTPLMLAAAAIILTIVLLIKYTKKK